MNNLMRNSKIGILVLVLILIALGLSFKADAFNQKNIIKIKDQYLSALVSKEIDIKLLCIHFLQSWMDDRPIASISFIGRIGQNHID